MARLIEREFIKFCTVGFSGLFVDMGVVVAFKTMFAFDTRICASFGFLAAVTTNYILNRLWTFEGARNTSLFTSYASYVTVCCVGFLARLGVMHLLIEYTSLDTGYGYIFNNLVGIGVGTAVNFIGSKYFAFSPLQRAFKR
ncbi:MAG: GtrA family protein [Desulfobacterota bacterium]|jgi:putative flippase GtrA|nr:GtrA family protein [Thermodesulfobacteriota bacterium]